MKTCSELVGPTPRGAIRTISLAVRDAMLSAECNRWLVAYSGGADSLALLVTAADIALRRGDSLCALTVEHGLRDDSATHAQQARNMAMTLGIEAEIVNVKVPSHGSIEAAARSARYQALRAYALHMCDQTTSGAQTGILLGHTMDDQAETVLLGLARGSGARSLAGMRPSTTERHVRWLRPLLGVRATDTRNACDELGLTAIEDPTNAVDGPWKTTAGEPLPRIALRHEAIPTLSRALGSDVVPALARTATLLRADADALDALTPQLDELDVEILSQLEPAIRTRVIKRAALMAGGTGLTSAHIEAIDALVTAYRGQGPVHLPGNVFAWREKTPSPHIRKMIRIRKDSPVMEHWEDGTVYDQGEENESL